MDDPVTLEKPLEEMDNDEIMDEIQYLTTAMRDGIIKAYKQDYSKENARRIASRLTSAVTHLSIRQNGKILDKQDEIDILQNNFNTLRYTYFELRDNYGDLANIASDLEDRNQLVFNQYMRTRQQLERKNDIILADQHNIRRLKKQIAILKIQNQWRQFRLINPPPIAPLPVQQIDQIWLLLQ